VDQVAAQGGAAGLRIGKGGQGAGGAQQVAGDGGTGQRYRAEVLSRAEADALIAVCSAACLRKAM
jgi:hypothetical protein